MPEAEIDGFPSPELEGFYDKVIKHLFDREKIAMVGRLEPDMVQIIRRLTIAQQLFSVPEWSSAISTFIEIGISEKGKSREEILLMVAGVNKQKGLIEKTKDSLNKKKPEATEI